MKRKKEEASESNDFPFAGRSLASVRREHERLEMEAANPNHPNFHLLVLHRQILSLVSPETPFKMLRELDAEDFDVLDAVQLRIDSIIETVARKGLERVRMVVLKRFEVLQKLRGVMDDQK